MSTVPGETDTRKISIVKLKKPIDIECEDGVTLEAELREMSDTVAQDYFKKRKSAFKFEGTGAARKVVDIDETDWHIELIKRCLYKKGSNELVDEKTIREWPPRALKEMYKDAENVNGIIRVEPKAEEEEKEKVAEGNLPATT